MEYGNYQTTTGITMDDIGNYQLIRHVAGLVCILVLLGLFIGEAFGTVSFPNRTVYVIVSLIGALLGLDQVVANTVFGSNRPPGGNGPGPGGGSP